MTTDLVPVVPDVASSLELADSAWRLAQRLGNTPFVPKGLRGQPESVLAAILTGQELGIQPMHALAKIHVIEGRPTLSAEMMRAIVMRAGHSIIVEETTNTRCVVVGERAGTDRPLRITWTMDDAKRANLAGKDNWRKYPRPMLVARATGELVRSLFPDVLAGITYTSEEMSDGDLVAAEDLDGDGEATATKPKKKTSKRSTKKVTKATAKPPAKEVDDEPEPEDRELPLLPGEDPAEEPPLPSDDEIVDAEIVGDDPAPPQDEEPARSGPVQVAMMLQRHKITDRQVKLDLVSSIIGRGVDTTKGLDPTEITLILEVVSAEDFDLASWVPVEWDPSEANLWNGDEWRSWLRSRKVKVGVAVARASEILADINLDGPVGSVDEVKDHAEIELGALLWASLDSAPS